MSNFLAVATVTEAVRQMIETAVQKDVDASISVTPARPSFNGKGKAPTSVHVYLYQVTQNAAWRNLDAPTRRADGSLAEKPRVALDLHYLLSFYGDETKLEPQRLLGSVVRALHAKPLLTRQELRSLATKAKPASSATHHLDGTDLAEQVDLVRLTPAAMSLEEFTKIWSVFLQSPHALSLAYVATVVLIEADETPGAALPVAARNVYATPTIGPVVERVVPEAGAGAPVFYGTAVLLEGRDLRAPLTRVRVGDAEATATGADLGDRRVRVLLGPPTFPATALRAGTQGAQVVHEYPMGTPETPHRVFESNAAAFVLRPRVRKPGAAYAVAATDVTVTGGTRSAKVSATLDPLVGKSQRVALLLNRLPPAGPVAYVFVQPSRAADGNDVEFDVAGVEPGDYLVRFQVDGAESPLDLDASGAYAEPKVSIA